MATYRTAYRQPQVGSQGFARTKKVFGGPAITLIAADVALNVPPLPAGQVAIARVPKGFIATSGNVVAGACDSGATLSMSVGFGTTLAALGATSTTFRAGGTISLAAIPAAGIEFTDDTDIILTATAAAAGLGATPTVNLVLEGYIK